MAAKRLRTQHIIFKVNFTTGKVSEFLENYITVFEKFATQTNAWGKVPTTEVDSIHGRIYLT